MTNFTVGTKQRPLSWSCISSFEYDPEQWAIKYLDGIKEPPNKAMLFGNEVGERIAKDPTYLPEVRRFSVFEKELLARIDKIYLIGFLDSYDPVTHAFKEYKTSANKSKWTQKSANEHGQLSMYKFLLWKNYGIVPENVHCELFYIPVEETGSFDLAVSKDPIQSFTVKHTTGDILRFAAYVKDIHRKMYDYALARNSAHVTV